MLDKFSKRDELISQGWVRFHLCDPNHRDENNPDFQFVEELDKLISSNTSNAIDVIVSIVVNNDDDMILSNVAAGPMEDLLRGATLEDIAKIERLSIEIPKFKRMLGGVWKNSIPDDIWLRIVKIAGPKF